MSELVLTQINENKTLTITLNRPEVHNAFNDDVIKIITKKFEEIEREEGIDRVIITGNGKSFCAGADLNWMKSMIDYSYEENVLDSKLLAGMFETINTCSVPVIGVVNGHALGGGVGLLSVCDYVIAKEGAKIGFTEVNLGLIPAVISPYCMQKIGYSNARALFLSGEKFDVHRAKDIGLVHEVASEQDFETKVTKLVDRFESLPTQALKSVKVLVNEVMCLSEDKMMEFTCTAIANQRTSAIGQEGMSALLEKRKPNWNIND